MENIKNEDEDKKDVNNNSQINNHNADNNSIHLKNNIISEFKGNSYFFNQRKEGTSLLDDESNFNKPQ